MSAHPLLAEIADKMPAPGMVLCVSAIITLAFAAMLSTEIRWKPLLASIYFLILICGQFLLLSDDDLGAWWWKELDYDYPLCIALCWWGIPALALLAVAGKCHMAQRRKPAQNA